MLTVMKSFNLKPVIEWVSSEVIVLILKFLYNNNNNNNSNDDDDDDDNKSKYLSIVFLLYIFSELVPTFVIDIRKSTNNWSKVGVVRTTDLQNKIH